MNSNQIHNTKKLQNSHGRISESVFLENLDKITVSIQSDEDCCDFIKLHGEKFRKLSNWYKFNGYLDILKHTLELKEYRTIDDTINKINFEEILCTASKKHIKNLTLIFYDFNTVDDENDEDNDYQDETCIPHCILYTYSPKSQTYKAYSAGPITFNTRKKFTDTISDNVKYINLLDRMTILNPRSISAPIPSTLTKNRKHPNSSFLVIHSTHKFTFGSKNNSKDLIDSLQHIYFETNRCIPWKCKNIWYTDWKTKKKRDYSSES
jgi:hypothetical protein